MALLTALRKSKAEAEAKVTNESERVRLLVATAERGRAAHESLLRA